LASWWAPRQNLGPFDDAARLETPAFLGTGGSEVRISRHPQVALGRAVRLRREAIGLTQEALADAADLDATSIRGLERGIANPRWDTADRIARALGLALHELALHADELETSDRQPTNQPLQRADSS
jgi:DNA-binding XRE family transcriptional regulator